MEKTSSRFRANASAHFSPSPAHGAGRAAATVSVHASRLLTLDLSGSFISRCEPSRARSMNEIEICTADPNGEANRHVAGTFSGGKATITGLTPGSTAWVRIRTLGLQNVKGAWSDPAKIMVV
jgi:hypothetical protein